MKKAIIQPSPLWGKVTVPPSKSELHRAVICSALCEEACTIENVVLSEDIEATLAAVAALGVSYTLDGTTLKIGKRLPVQKPVAIDCRESGSTLRFMIPVAAALGCTVSFIGSGNLPNRPIRELTDTLLSCKTVFHSDKSLPLTVSGKLKGGRCTISGNTSSQYITGLLFALPLCEEDSEIILTSPLQSRAYVDMTIETQEKFGITIQKTPDGYRIPGRQVYKPCRLYAGADWSQAAFFLVAGAIGNHVYAKGLDENSTQGDKKILDLLESASCEILKKNDSLCCHAHAIKSFEADASQIPDLVPILAVLGTFAQGESRIYHAERLIYKESNRLAAIAEGLNQLGGCVQVTSDGLLIRGVSGLKSGTVCGYNDHRIVMSLAIAATRTDGPVTITDSQSINKSYPRFFTDYKALGGNVNVINMG